MTGPALRGDLVPIEPEANKRWREQMFELSENDEEMQQMFLRKCQNSIEYFVDGFCWTLDPREISPNKPFVLWPKQRKFLLWLEVLYQRSQLGEKINIVIDKPRAIGVSYCLLVWHLWHYIFDDFTARIGSRKEDYVDKKGDPDALFPKLDYQLDRLPLWLQGSNDRTYMMLKPHAGRSQKSIVGESANPNFGRGGRKNSILFDEFAFWEYAKSSWESSGESTNFRIAVSTPPESGKDSYFYKLLTGQKGKIFKFEFNWNDDPRRNDQWLVQARESKSEEEFAREVLKSFEGTTKGKVYAVSVRFATLNNVDYQPNLPLFVSWDFGLDTVAMIWWQKDFSTNQVYMIDCYHNENKEIGFYVPFVNGIVASDGQTVYNNFELEMIERHRQWSKNVTHFGDPDVKKRNLINKESVKDWLHNNHGIYVQSQSWGGREWTDLKEKTILLFKRLTINESRCEPALSALRNAKYPEVREGSQRTTESTNPVHDWTSHFRTSAEYFADNEPETNVTKTIVGSTAPAQGRIKLPHEIEMEREKEEKLQIKVKTVLQNVFHNSGNNPNRIL